MIREIKEVRVCNKCNIEKLEYSEMKYERIIMTDDYGLVEIYKCDNCGDVDLYFVDEDEWNSEKIHKYEDDRYIYEYDEDERGKYIDDEYGEMTIREIEEEIAEYECRGM